MIINDPNLDSLFKGFTKSFNKGFEGAKSRYRDVAMVAPSSTALQLYGWLGQIPRIREWIGERVINNLRTHGFAIKNKTFESTIEVQRTDIEDDQYGVYGPLFEEMGRTAAEHPDELIFALLKAGFTTPCYDGQYFFDMDHPVANKDGLVVDLATGAPIVAANTDGGNGPAWFMFDTSRAIKPLIWQTRTPYELTSITRQTDMPVFLQDIYLYGIRARANAGFGLWQLAWGSKQPLDFAHYKTARETMMSLRGETGRLLGIVPDTLIVPPSLESNALQILNADRDAAGATNIYRDTAKLIITPWLAD